MDELPSEAKALLELAKDGHDPPDVDARARVRRRLAVALTVPAASASAGVAPGASTGSAAGAGKAFWASWLGAKGWVAAALLVAGVGGATLAPWKRGSAPEPAARRAEPSRSAPAQQEAQRDTQTAPALVPPPARSSPQVAAQQPSVTRTQRRLGRGPHAAHGLSRETELLAAAAELLKQGDVTGARGLLEQHRSSFPSPQLREEREGLLVLARCVESPAAARKQARQFIVRAPASVLVARIASACALRVDEE